VCDTNEAEDPLIQRIKVHMSRPATQIITPKITRGEERNGQISPIASAIIAGSMATLKEKAERSNPTRTEAKRMSLILTKVHQK